MDQNTALAILGANLVNKEVLLKLVGPTADYLGQGAKDLIEKGMKNVRRILEIAVKRLGSKIEEDGQIPPRVIKGLLEEGPYCDDELRAEYLGGVLAASRTTDTRDDRAACIQKQVASLSAYQIRTHYIVYASIKQRLNGANVALGTDRERAKMFIPGPSYVQAMQLQPNVGVSISASEFSSIVSHSLAGLQRQGLLDNFGFGDADHNKASLGIAQMGMWVVPSIYGLEVFFWANGFRDVLPYEILNPMVKFGPWLVPIPEGARPVHPITVVASLVEERQTAAPSPPGPTLPSQGPGPDA